MDDLFMRMSELIIAFPPIILSMVISVKDNEYVEAANILAHRISESFSRNFNHDSQKNDIQFVLLMLVPTLGSILILTYIPAFRGIWMAFQNYNMFDLSDTSFNNFANFRKMLADDIFLLSLKNTIIWVVVSLAAQFVLGFVLALLREPFKGRGVYSGFVFYPGRCQALLSA